MIKLSDRMQYKLDLTTVICNQCSFVFANPIPTKESYDRFYQTTYSVYYGGIASRPEGDKRLHIPVGIKRRIEQIEQIRAISSRTLLEIGPGNGLFLWWASQKGCQVAGIEPSEDFCSRIQAEGLTCFHDLIENIDPSKLVKYDFVVMLHVLEHFIDPNSVLRRCRDLLKDNGLIVIEVPNILRPYRSLDRYFLRYVHLSYFSPQTLTLILRKHGFGVVFADNGDHDRLNPANLFVIAQKSEIIDGTLIQTMPNANEVYHFLKRYRIEWMVFRAPVWYLHMWYHRIRRFAYKTARELKRKLT